MWTFFLSQAVLVVADSCTAHGSSDCAMWFSYGLVNTSLACTGSTPFVDDLPANFSRVVIADDKVLTVFEDDYYEGASQHFFPGSHIRSSGWVKRILSYKCEPNCRQSTSAPLETESCFCGNSGSCQRGEYCYTTHNPTDAGCRAFPTHCLENTTHPINLPCTCGDTDVCDAGKFCYTENYGGTSNCVDSPLNCALHGIAGDLGACKCGDITTCESQQLCTQDARTKTLRCDDIRGADLTAIDSKAYLNRVMRAGLGLMGGQKRSEGKIFIRAKGGICVLEGWNDVAADVACRSMGYSSGRTHRAAAFGGNSDGLEVRMNCNGHEHHISECTTLNRIGSSRPCEGSGAECFECDQDADCSDLFDSVCIDNECKRCWLDLHCKNPQKPKCTRNGCQECSRDADCKDPSRPDCSHNTCKSCPNPFTALCAAFTTDDSCLFDVEPGSFFRSTNIRFGKVRVVDVVAGCDVELFTGSGRDGPRISLKRGRHTLDRFWSGNVGSYKCRCQGRTDVYQDLGFGKCVLRNGAEVEPTEWHDKTGDGACEKMCDGNVRCGGYSVNSHNHCLLYLRAGDEMMREPGVKASAWNCVVRRRSVTYNDLGPNKCGALTTRGIREPPSHWVRSRFCELHCSVRPDCNGYSAGEPACCLLWLVDRSALVAVQGDLPWDPKWEAAGGTRCMVKNATTTTTSTTTTTATTTTTSMLGKVFWEECGRKSGPCDFCGDGNKCCRKNWEGGENGCFAGEGGENRHECVDASAMLGKVCWEACGWKSGPCDFCGDGNKCCRKNWEGGENGCFASEGGENHHECIESSALLGEACWKPCGKKSGPCNFCGDGNKCCRKNWQGGENGCFASEGGENRHECVESSACGTIFLPGSKQVTVLLGSHNMAQSNNDKAYKLQVNAGFAVQVFEHYNFRGEFGQFERGSHELEEEWRATISSYKCQRSGAATLIRANVECRSPDVDLGSTSGPEACAQKCLDKPGCEFLIYGIQEKQGNCFWEKTKTRNCAEGWENDQYDFYTVKKNSRFLAEEGGTSEFVV